MPDKNALVEQNLRLVHACCKKFVNSGMEYEDLYQVGCIGLIKAANNFNSSLGYSFSTYAVPAILGEIKRLFRDTGPVKMSRSLKELVYKTARAQDKLSNTLGRNPTVAELATELGCSNEEVAEALCAAAPVQSMTFESDDSSSQMDIPVITDDKLIEKINISTALEKLESRDKEIIRLRYYKGKTQSETAKLLGMTQVQVSRREKSLLYELKKMLA